MGMFICLGFVTALTIYLISITLFFDSISAGVVAYPDPIHNNLPTIETTIKIWNNNIWINNSLIWNNIKISSISLIQIIQIIRLDLLLTCNWFCIRDSIREWTSSYNMISISNPILCVVFIFSEILFFLTFFWSSFHCSCSVGINQPISAGFYEPDPNDLTYTNTVLLSNSGISLSVGWCSNVAMNLSFLGCLLGLVFMSLQVLEFHNTSLYLNESIFCCHLFLVIGLHLFHVVVGLYFILCCLSVLYYSRYIINFVMYQLRVTIQHLTYHLQLVYWHFVDLLWLSIYFTFYT